VREISVDKSFRLVDVDIHSAPSMEKGIVAVQVQDVEITAPKVIVGANVSLKDGLRIMLPTITVCLEGSWLQ
jgi:hypothetical protein